MNDYQRQFLRHLCRCRVRFLVVGGQARRLADQNTPTRDLDVWVDIDGAAHDTTRDALVSWVTQHSAHSSGQLASVLERMRQLKLPDAGGAYIDDQGAVAEISTEDGVDVLTSVGDASFELAHRDAPSTLVDGISLSYLPTAKS